MAKIVSEKFASEKGSVNCGRGRGKGNARGRETEKGKLFQIYFIYLHNTNCASSH